MAKKSSTRPLRVGLIGMGAIADATHFPAWKELQDEGRVEIVAGADVRLETAQKMGEKWGFKGVHTDYKAMLKAEQLDIVDICVHNRYHCDATVAALKAGAHVLVEKPMAMSVAEALKMEKTALDAGRKLMVAQHFRFEASAQKIKQLVDAGELGDIYTARAVWLRRRGIPGWGRFHIAEESMGGPLADIGVHVMDLCVWLMGSPKPVSVSGSVYRKFGDRDDLVNTMPSGYERKTFDVEDHAVALVRFEGGQSMMVEASWAANIAQDVMDVSLMGDKGGATVFPARYHSYDKDSLTTRNYDWMPQLRGHREEIRHFTECIEQGKPVLVQPRESVNIQKIIMGMYESARKGREIALK